jgi:hypothetical protein
MTNIKIIIIVSLVLAGITLSDAFAQGQQFETYNDPEGRFAIEYPSDWFVNEEPNTSMKDMVVQFDSSEPDMAGNIDITKPNVHVMVRDPLPEETSLERLSNNLVNNMAEAGEIKESNYTTLSGLPAYTIANILFDIHSKSVWTIHNDKIYNIIYNAHSYDYEIYLPVFHQMITSFHITN